MAFEIYYYEKSDKCPAADFLDSLAPKAKAKCLKYIELFQARGFALPGNFLEKVEGNLWALRPELGGNEYRIFFCQTAKNEIVILHAAQKKQRRLASCGLDIAQRRRDEVVAKARK